MAMIHNYSEGCSGCDWYDGGCTNPRGPCTEDDNNRSKSLEDMSDEEQYEHAKRHHFDD